MKNIVLVLPELPLSEGEKHAAYESASCWSLTLKVEPDHDSPPSTLSAPKESDQLWYSDSTPRRTRCRSCCDFQIYGESESRSVWPAFRKPMDYKSWNSLGQNTGVCSLSLLQGNLPNPGIESKCPALQAYSLPAEPQGKW